MRSQRAAALAISCAAVAVFLWLAIQVSHGETMGFDGDVRNAVHSRASPAVTIAMRAITRAGSEWFLAPFGGVLVWWLLGQGLRRAAVQLAVAWLGAESLNQALKLICRRIRPEAFFDYPNPGSYSFPSGHAFVGGCFFAMLAVILTGDMRSRAARMASRIAAALVVLIIGLSRVYLGVHYPTDVLGGYVLAAAWLSAIRAVSPEGPRAASPA